MRRALLLGVCACASLTWTLAPFAAAAFPGRNGLIAYNATDSASGGTTIWVMNPDGSGQRALTTRTQGDSSWPAWSADGQKIAFVSYRNNHNDIFTMDANGGHQTQVTHEPNPKTGSSGDVYPSWSPDGRRIVFQSFDDAAYGQGRQQILVVNADGSGRTRISDPAKYESAPAWSPDGKWIAFEENGSLIAVMTPAGKQFHRITDGHQPSWSPDGSRLAMTREGSLWTVKADGSGARQVALHGDGNFYAGPKWSPDGKLIVMTEHRPTKDGYRVVRIRPDGTGKAVLRDYGNPNAYGADWQPIAPKTTPAPATTSGGFSGGGTPRPEASDSGATSGSSTGARASATPTPTPTPTPRSASASPSSSPLSSGEAIGGANGPTTVERGRRRSAWPYVLGALGGLAAIGGCALIFLRLRSTRV